MIMILPRSQIDNVMLAQPTGTSATKRRNATRSTTMMSEKIVVAMPKRKMKTRGLALNEVIMS
jgi:hypothetical protein